MRAVVQRVTHASVTVDEKVVGEIGPGLLVLVGVTHDDTVADARTLAKKIVGMRVFPDAGRAMERSLGEAGGSVLVVSQFTLYAGVSRGRRPSLTAAASPDVAEPLVEEMIEELRTATVPVATGVFGAYMAVSLVNDGPVTILLETKEGRLV